MKARIIITVILLAFVVASVAYLVIGEWRDDNYKNDDDHYKNYYYQNISTAPVSLQVSEQAITSESAPAAPVVPEKKPPRRKVVVYYFYGNSRCSSCRTTESYAKEAIETGFPDALRDGRLEWKAVNVEESRNEHFIGDFKLVTRSVVIEKTMDTKRTRWKNLKKVWALVRNKDAFIKYVQDETRAYLDVPADVF